MKKITTLLSLLMLLSIFGWQADAQCNFKITFQKTPVYCNGESTGSATATASQGTAPYSYLWANGATTATISNLAAGSYIVTATDANGCAVTDTVVITQKPVINSVQIVTAATCFGACNGLDSVAVSGGNPPYSFVWSTGATTQAVSGLCPGIYTVTITDSKGCEKLCVGHNAVTEPTEIVVGTIKTDVKCFGECTGTASAAVTGGVAPISYLWSNGATTAAVSGLCSGSYTVTATDAKGCSKSATLVIGENTEIHSVQIVTASTCYGACNGTDSVAVSGGTAPYAFLWNTGATTQSISGLCAGIYTVTITDALGCVKVCVGHHAVTDPSPVVLATGKTNVTCFNACNGTANATPSGGTAPYSYLWSTGATSATISALCPGTYTVTATDAKGCSALAYVTITQPTVVLPNVVVTVANLPGTITASPTGGTAPYTFLWNNGSTTASINNLGAGTFTVTVTDANGCSATDHATLDIPCGGFNTHTQGGWGAPHNCTNSCHGNNNNNNCGWYYNNTSCNNGWTWGNYNNYNNCGNNWNWGGSCGNNNGGNHNNNNNCNNNNNNNNCGNYWNNHSNNHNHNNNNNCNNGWGNNNNGWGNNNNNGWNNNNNGWGNNNNNGWGNNNNGWNNNNNCSNYNWGGYCNNNTVYCNNANCTCDNNPCGNPAAYMYANFAAAFPNGIVIGCTNKLKLTSAQAVTNFLPSGSTPRALPNGTLLNPGGTYSNVLAGQVVALALNLGFDAYDPAFAASGTLLSSQVVVSGPFAGLTVQQVFDEANRKLGGCVSSYSFSSLNSVVTAINEAYDNCNTNSCFLTCPSGSNRIIMAGADEIVDQALTNSMLNVYPNPSDKYVVVDFRNAVTQNNTVEIYNYAGQLVNIFKGDSVMNNEVVVDTKELPTGIYTVTLRNGDQSVSQKLVVTH